MSTKMLNLLSEETFSEKMDTQNALLAAIARQGGEIVPQSWSDVQGIVRLGLASKIFAVGDQLSCQKGGKTLIWDIIGIDHDIPTNKNFKHSLTLQLHNCFASMPLDARGAFYYAEEGLEAGTYNFTVGQHNWVSTEKGKTYQFTLTEPVPAKGQLVLSASYNATIEGTNVRSFAGSDSAERIESAKITEGSEGTSLGTIKDAVNGNLNSCQRALLGSNDYATSAIRQYLNSSAVAGSVWKPQTKFDRPPSWAETTEGFQNEIDADFLAVIGEVDKITAQNTISDGGGSVTSSEKFFLLSRTEAYSGRTNSIYEGTAYPYYSGNSDLSSAGTGKDANRIKYLGKTAQIWWLRSPSAASAGNTQYIMTEGNCGSGGVNYSYGVAPACCIV